MMRLSVMFAMLAIASAAIYLKRETARNFNDYNDPLRLERMTAVGISVDYLSEPVAAWKLVSGHKKLELTGGASILTCLDWHLILKHPFLGLQQPTTMGEAINQCKLRPDE